MDIWGAISLVDTPKKRVIYVATQIIANQLWKYPLNSISIYGRFSLRESELPETIHRYFLEIVVYLHSKYISIYWAVQIYL